MAPARPRTTRKPTLTRSALLLVAVCSSSLCNLADAVADVTSNPYPGVTHIARSTSTQKIHVVLVDLSLKTIRVRATRPPGGMTVPRFASDYGVQVAINGDFGTRTAPFKTSGWAMGDGEVWTNTSDNAAEGFTAFGVDNRVMMSTPAEIFSAPEDWMVEIVGGRPLIVDGGEVLDTVAPHSRDGCSPHFCQAEPRSAIGISQDGQTLILATIDGRYSGAAGMTTKQVGALMAEFGAWRALNIDGGGSSTLLIAAEGGVVNRPSDGCCRVVSNHIGIQIVEPFGDLTGYVRYGTIDNEEEPIAGATVTLSTGESTTTDADGKYTIEHVPAGDVVITAGAAGYAEASSTRYVAAADLTWGSIALDDQPDEPPAADAGPDEAADDDAPGGMHGGCSIAGAPSLVTVALLLALALPALLRRRRG